MVIDAATPRVVCPAIRTGHLPVLQKLAQAGAMHEASATIFPSITPAATTSIVTGAYPAEHGIAGASWYDDTREEIAYYGDDFWVIAREGFGAFVRDFLTRLNGDRLTAPTLFEMIERTGGRAACLNYLVFRGTSAHRVNMPELLAALPGVPYTATIEGPSILALGDFVGRRSPQGRELARKSGLLHRFGMDDASTGAMLAHLMAEGSLPDFTVAYFADNDYRSHEVGPHAALGAVAEVDRMLGQAFEAAGGIDRVLSETFIVVTSDHAQSEVLAEADRGVIRLDALLGGFRQAALGRPWRTSDDIMICPNMRAAQVYLREPSAARVARAVAAGLTDHRVDLAIHRASLVRPGERGYVVTSVAGTLEFERAGGPARATDAFGGGWNWRGDLSVLDLALDDATLHDGQYPNAFERIAGVLDLEKSGEIWFTARPGCEFRVPGGDAHVGGASHGSLHVLDSFSPVIVAGPSRVELPAAMRSVDIAPLCMRLLGLEMRYVVGQKR